MKEPVAAKGNILSAAAADRAVPGSPAGHSGPAQGRVADAKPAAPQPAKASSGPAHLGLHVSLSAFIGQHAGWHSCLEAAHCSCDRAHGLSVRLLAGCTDTGPSGIPFHPVSPSIQDTPGGGDARMQQRSKHTLCTCRTFKQEERR